MKKFLALTLVFMLCLSCLPGVVAFGTMNTLLDDEAPKHIDNHSLIIPPDDSTLFEGEIGTNPGLIFILPTDGGGGSGEADPGDCDNSLYVGPIWKLIFDYNKAGEKTASAVAYLLPVSDDGVIEYEPGSWLLDQILNKLDTFALEQSCIELSAGSSGPVCSPALSPYTGDEAGEPVYSALFKLPAQDEGRSFPDDGIALFLKFPGDIIVSVPAQQATSVLDAIDLKVYNDRVVVELVGSEDAEVYIQLPAVGTPVWIDAEGNELEAEYEETDGGYKVKVQSGLTLVFKA